MPVKTTELHLNLKGCKDKRFWANSNTMTVVIVNLYVLLPGGNPWWIYIATTTFSKTESSDVYLFGRQEPLLSSYQTVMTELSVAVTQRNSVALINPPLPLLCSPKPISNLLCLFFPAVSTNGLSNPQRETESEREAGGLRKQGQLLMNPQSQQVSLGCREMGGKRDIRRVETGKETRGGRKTHFTI